MSAFVPHLGSLFAQSPQAINSATSSFRSGVTSFVTPIRRKAKLRFNMTLASSQENMLGPPAQGLERLICAAGCFWGLELAFQRVPGVISTRVGYTQGKTKNPSYRAVCFGITGHTEALAVDYDPKQTSYAKLLDLFWKRLGNSALTLNRAGNDVGTQYRSGVYYLNDEQKNLAQQSAKKVSEDLGQQVITEIKAGVDVPFYLAEEYVLYYCRDRAKYSDLDVPFFRLVSMLTQLNVRLCDFLCLSLFCSSTGTIRSIWKRAVNVRQKETLRPFDVTVRVDSFLHHVPTVSQFCYL